MFKFKRTDFFPMNGEYDLSKLSSCIESILIKKKINHNFIVNDISSKSYIRKNSIIFLNDLNILENFICDDVCIVTSVDYNNNDMYKNIFFVKDLSEAYNLILNFLYNHEDCKNFSDEFVINEGSHISIHSSISDNVKIGKNCVIGRGVKIGTNSIIKNNVVIKNAIIGENVVIGDNTTIGSTGFGFDFNKRGSNYLNPQIGIVHIDNNCHIGSSCTIDRAKIDITYIGQNSMIDNLVHLAHNVTLSENACIAAQTGISGSVNIGPNVTIGGQVGIAGHINIGKNVVIAAKSGVTKNIKDKSIVAGFPATDIKLWKRKIINERRYKHK